MKKFLAKIIVCALVLSCSGLAAAEEKKAETPPAAAAPAPAVKPDAAQASPDDMKWIAQCIIDNKDEGQPMEVVQKYCECMNSKMEDSEIQSVTQWEKTHPKERKECSDNAGWK